MPELYRFQQQGYLSLVSSGPIFHLPRRGQMAGDRRAVTKTFANVKAEFVARVAASSMFFSSGIN